MKIKRLFTLLIATVMILSSTVNCFAGEIEISGDEISVSGDDIEIEEVYDNSISLSADDPMPTGDPDTSDPNPDPEPVYYKITNKTSPSSSGTISTYLCDEKLTQFEEGDVVSLKFEEKVHFTFMYWSISPDNVVIDDINAIETSFVMPASDVTITAYTDEEEYKTVTYSGGSNSTTVTSYTDKKYLSSDLTLRKVTYTSKDSMSYQTGWSLNPDGSTKDFAVSSKYTANESITLYPYYESKHTVIIKPDENCVETEEYTYIKNPGAKVTIPGSLYTAKEPDETIRQYGWKIEGTDKRKYTTSVTAGDDEDVVLVPMWEKIYTIHYLPGKYGTPINDEELVSHKYCTIVENSANITRSNGLANILFLRPGWIQSGWTLTEDSQSVKYSLGAGTTSYPDSNLTLYPVWKKNVHTITYKPGSFADGEEYVDNCNSGYKYYVRYGEYERNGFTQIGWNTVDGATSADSSYTFNKQLTISDSSAESIVLYPVWQENKYPIKINGIQVCGSNVDDILSDGTVSYDSAENTLILNSSDITSEQLKVIEISIAEDDEVDLEDVNISFNGDNKITSELGMTLSSKIPVNISGEGKLELYSDILYGEYDGVLSVDNNIEVTGNIDGNDADAESVDTVGTALNTYKYLCFESFDDEHRGVLEGYVYVGGTRVKNSNLSGEGWSYDIESETLTLTDIAIRDFSTVTVKDDEDKDVEITCGIYSDYDLNIVINGICAEGSSYSKPNYAIYTKGNLNISKDGEGSFNLYGDYGITANKNVKINGADIFVHSTNESVIDIHNFTINDSVVELTSGDFGLSIDGDLRVNRAEFNVLSDKTALTVGGNTYVVDSDLDIKGGETAIVTGAYNQTGGNTVFITTEDLFGNGNLGLEHYAMVASGNMTLTGGNLYAEAQYQAIYNLGANLYIYSGSFKVRDRATEKYYKADGTTVVNPKLIYLDHFFIYSGELDSVGFGWPIYLSTLNSSDKKYYYYGGRVHLSSTGHITGVYATNGIMGKYPVIYWYKYPSTYYVPWTVKNNGAFSTSAPSYFDFDLIVLNAIAYIPGDGITGDVVNASIINGIPTTLKGALFEKDGYVQTGWATEENGAKKYDLNGRYYFDKSTALYPVWTKSITIKYFKDETSEPIVEYQPMSESIILKGRTFEDDVNGYLQNGWYIEENEEIKHYDIGAEYILPEEFDGTEPLCFYVTWDDKATVTYLPGSNCWGDEITRTPQLYRNGLLEDRLFTKPGFFQSGWSLSDGGEKVYELNQEIYFDKDMTFYPYWTEGYVVEYRMGSAPGFGEIDFAEGITEDDVYLIENYGTNLVIPADIYKYIPAAGENSEYVMLGWSTENNGHLEVNFGDSFTVEDNLVLYPVWGKDAMRIDVIADTYALITPVERIAIYDYIGTAIKPQVVVYDGSAKLTEGKDYSVSYKNNVNASMTAADLAAQHLRVTDLESGLNASALNKLPTILITGKGDYSGKQTVYFSIKPADIGTSAFTDSGDVTYEYNPKRVVNNKPIPTISGTVNGKTVKLGNKKDFKLKYVATSGDNAGLEMDVITMPGSYDVIAEGIGNFMGSRTIEAIVTLKKSISTVTIKNAGNLPYTGEPVVHEDLQVLVGKIPLVENVDYTVSYIDNIETGTATLIISGIGDYVGTKIIPFKITGIEFKNVTMEGFAKAFNYTGSEIEQIYIRFHRENADETIHFLKEGEDYVAEYSDNVLPGVATVTFSGKGGYTGSVTKTFKINGVALSKATFKNYNSALSYYYSGAPVTLDNQDIKLEIKNGSTITQLNKVSEEDYENHVDGYVVRYNSDINVKGNNINVGVANAQFVGSGIYQGTVNKTFKIVAYDMSAESMLDDANKRIILDYDPATLILKGGAKSLNKVSFVADDGSENVLKEDVDYKVVYKNNLNVNDLSGKNKPTFTISGIGNFKGSLPAVEFAILQKPIEYGYGVTATAADKSATGKPGNYITTLKVVDTDGKELKAGVDYEKVIKYVYIDTVAVTNNKEEVIRAKNDVADAKDAVPALEGGTHMKAVISGRGNYSGEVEIPYRIAGAEINTCKVEFNKKFYFNNGRPVEPSYDDFTVKVKDGKNYVDLNRTQYEIVANSYAGSTKKGAASFTIRGIDGYCGTMVVKYNILPKEIIWWFL